MHDVSFLNVFLVTILNIRITLILFMFLIILYDIARDVGMMSGPRDMRSKKLSSVGRVYYLDG